VRVPKLREPILNVPAVVLAVLATLVIIHLVRMFMLSAEDDRIFLYTFAFVPARYDAGLVDGVLPGGFGATIWTFVSYALIHADLSHLGFNAIWLLAFGSPVARRFGPLRTLASLAVTAAAGALAHLATHAGELEPMIGASGAISGMMAAATRFVFQPGGSLDMWRGIAGDPDRIPAAPLAVALRNPRVLAFLAVWFGVNLLFGLGSVSIIGDDHSVAWQAHVGGFLAGLLLFSAFDPIAAPANRDLDRTLH
jgi:membrane associated rhomboid family serine protease